MGSNAKSRFYSDLQKNYREEKEKSVVFKFLRDTYLTPPNAKPPQDTPAAGRSAARETYLSRLWAHYQRFKIGQEDTLEYAGHLFDILLGRRVLYQSRFESAKGGRPDEMLARLVETGLGLAKDESWSEKRKKAQLHRSLEELVRLLSSGDEAVRERLAPCAGKLRAFTDAILTSAIHLEVRQFFYDAGYPYRDDGDQQDGEERIGRKIQRAHEDNNALRLLYQYYGRTIGDEAPEAVSVGDFREPTAGECQQLYDYLSSRSDYEDILLPLRVDQVTGCALYIVGNSYYSDPYDSFGERRAPVARGGKRGARPSCFFGIMRLWALDHHDIPLDFDGAGFIVCNSSDTLPDAHTALMWYKRWRIQAAEEIWEDCIGQLPKNYIKAFWRLGRLKHPAKNLEKAKRDVLKEDQAAFEGFQRLGSSAAF